MKYLTNNVIDNSMAIKQSSGIRWYGIIDEQNVFNFIFVIDYSMFLLFKDWYYHLETHIFKLGLKGHVSAEIFFHVW